MPLAFHIRLSLLILCNGSGNCTQIRSTSGPIEQAAPPRRVQPRYERECFNSFLSTIFFKFSAIFRVYFESTSHFESKKQEARWLSVLLGVSHRVIARSAIYLEQISGRRVQQIRGHVLLLHLIHVCRTIHVVYLAEEGWCSPIE
jgi:hypothetical protein